MSYELKKVGTAIAHRGSYKKQDAYKDLKLKNKNKGEPMKARKILKKMILRLLSVFNGGRKIDYRKVEETKREYMLKYDYYSPYKF